MPVLVRLQRLLVASGSPSISSSTRAPLVSIPESACSTGASCTSLRRCELEKARGRSNCGLANKYARVRIRCQIGLFYFHLQGETCMTGRNRARW